jgi:hypothetical protein
VQFRGKKVLLHHNGCEELLAANKRARVKGPALGTILNGERRRESRDAARAGAGGKEISRYTTACERPLKRGGKPHCPLRREMASAAALVRMTQAAPVFGSGLFCQLEPSLRNLADEPIRHLQIITILH